MKAAITTQRLENAVISAVSVFIYYRLGFNFLILIFLFPVFDLSMLGYLVGKRAGAWSYNLVHNFIPPVILILSGLEFSSDLALGAGLIWIIHVSLDRALGFGLKTESGFSHTHLGRIGEKK
jgi:hypothetical protein